MLVGMRSASACPGRSGAGTSCFTVDGHQKRVDIRYFPMLFLDAAVCSSPVTV